MAQCAQQQTRGRSIFTGFLLSSFVDETKAKVAVFVHKFQWTSTLGSYSYVEVRREAGIYARLLNVCLGLKFTPFTILRRHVGGDGLPLEMDSLPKTALIARVARCPVLNRTVRFWGDLSG